MSRLAKVKRGRLCGAFRFVFYGVAGVGKSTLAASAPDPIFLDTEGGSELLDCARYPFRDGSGGHVAESYEEVTAALEDLATSKHDFKTVVIDTIDALEGLMWAYMCERDRKVNIEAYGYKKGHEAAVDEWRALCHALDKLRQRRGLNVVLVGHAKVATFKNPEGEDYDRFDLKIDHRAGGLLRGWCDVLGLCSYDDVVGKLDGESRARGRSTGLRQVRFERAAAHEAKSRLPLAPAVELADTYAWAPIAAAIELHQLLARSSPAELRKLIAAELERIGDDELTAKVTNACEGADSRRLAEFFKHLKRR